MEKTTNPTQESEIFSSSVIRQDISSVCLGETKAPDVLDPGYPQRDAENSMVQAWLINSMDVDIGRSYLFLPFAKELWEAVTETYYDLGNAAQLFEFKSQLRHQNGIAPRMPSNIRGCWIKNVSLISFMDSTKNLMKFVAEFWERILYPLSEKLLLSYTPYPVSKLTKDTNCVTKFCGSKCLFQDPILGRMTGNAKEYEGLYYLENKGPVKGHAQVSQCEFVSSKIMLCTIVKYKVDGSVDSYKARLVAKGFTQTYGVDYLKTFAPVAKLNTVRILLSLAANLDWPDIKNVFFNGELEEEVYMDMPPGDDKEELEGLNAKLACEFEIKNLGPLRYFLGMEVARIAKGILVTQQKYTLDMLKDTGMIDCKLDVTLVEPNRKLGLEENSAPVERGRYQRLVGRLIYLSHIRLDIAFAVSLVSQFIHSPREAHLVAVNRILQYLKSTSGKGLYFDKGEKKNIEAFVDVDWARNIMDKKSTTCYCTKVWGNLVTWISKKQTVVARSSAKVEFRALAHTVCELIWIERVLKEL
ncbi:reverse transcriptase Ty1/copia-type domain-containing protein [Citrus sinensis]|uniref:Reverse transcriptase Ty1/copia-type domain-containing protein n=1 Tax=Citrus sinensis TaxID=2711 RepID=A0ACB8HX23_CITSI|nr:reverse transcriptase Ty1/copia-type domain-containing protein [Citrus sinensis]